MAVHDGPGIRTTIFFKGCPLRCRWCHNPESMTSQPVIGFIPGKCVGCGKCVEACPNNAHIIAEGQHIFKRELCTNCGKCVSACLPGALELYGKEIDVAEAENAVLEDITFYEQSGGGCTLSGGEPLLQDKFCEELLIRLGKAGIHRAVDTSGAVNWSAFESVIPHTDMFLYDLKHMNDSLHREYIGASNRKSIDNLQRLSRCGIPIEIRIPVIPDFNADRESIGAFIDFIGKLDNITGVVLLPFHHSGMKYENTGFNDLMKNTVPPSKSQIDEIKDMFRKNGIRIMD